jgi:hypothetical protein
MAREGNTLSPRVREAWDSGNLQTLPKHNAERATGAHISIIGHITDIELQRHLTETEAGNGFANRFIWICCRRSKELPHGGGDVDLEPLVDRLQKAIAFANGCKAPMRRDEEADATWCQVYGPLSAGKPGMLGAVISRAEAQVLRLSVIYALLDCSPVVHKVHLLAALALWDYAEDSARYIFGDRLGDPIADTILDALRGAGADGLDREDIYNLLGRHQKAARVTLALEQLLATGLITVTKLPSDGGRPRTMFHAR